MTTPARNAFCSRLLIAALPLALSGCFMTQTEVVTASDSVRLAGRQFVQEESPAGSRTVFTWNEAQKAYIDPEQMARVRFVRLKGQTYLAQIELRDPNDPSSASAARLYALMPAKVVGSTLSIEAEECHEDSRDREWTARGYGIERDTRREMLTGSREGIIGYIAQMFACETSKLDFRITPQSLTPGGEEFDRQGARFDRGRFVTRFSAGCDRGERDSCYRFGQMLRDGDGVTADGPRAARLFDQVCREGDVRACLDLGRLYDSGTGVSRNRERAAELFKQACDGGDMFGCELLKKR